MDVEKEGKEQPVIKIVISNDIPYIWNASEWLRLRTDHRICGAFDGAVHQSVKQFKGLSSPSLPVRLSRVEAQYLVKWGVALAFQIPALSQSMPKVSKGQVEELRDQRRVEQLEVHRNKRRMQIESMVDKIIQGKLKKGRGIVPDRNTVIQEEVQKVELPYEMTQIDVADPWISETDLIPCDYPVPDNALDKLRYRVFEDFHLRRKYFLSSALKFGGDFLAYPGDPNVTHSEFIIVCHDNSRSKKPPYIHSQVRLANTVKKVLLLATFDEKNEKLKYKAMNTLQLCKKRRLNAMTESHVNDTEMQESHDNNEKSTEVDATG
ncbi:unnamed protein product [Orchesella dallaii]|uniref:tRNA-intron lyase n=1 Tax=Orchesella dallaii TaxID=48710 RepID=A0ABP1PQ67_9HEXA